MPYKFPTRNRTSDQTKKKKKNERRTLPAIERCEATLFTSNKKVRAQGTKSQINA
jgi:hypothetical protein